MWKRTFVYSFQAGGLSVPQIKKVILAMFVYIWFLILACSDTLNLQSIQVMLFFCEVVKPGILKVGCIFCADFLVWRVKTAREIVSFRLFFYILSLCLYIILLRLDRVWEIVKSVHSHFFDCNNARISLVLLTFLAMRPQVVCVCLYPNQQFSLCWTCATSGCEWSHLFTLYSS